MVKKKIEERKYMVLGNFRIYKYDSLNLCIDRLEKTKYTKDGKKLTTEKWNRKGYFPSLDRCLEYLLNEKISDTLGQDIKETRKAILGAQSILVAEMNKIDPAAFKLKPIEGSE